MFATEVHMNGAWYMCQFSGDSQYPPMVHPLIFSNSPCKYTITMIVPIICGRLAWKSINTSSIPSLIRTYEGLMRNFTSCKQSLIPHCNLKTLIFSNSCVIKSVKSKWHDMKYSHRQVLNRHCIY